MSSAAPIRLSLTRLLLIAVLALFSGPRAVAMAGEGSAICGAGGAARIVAYDFQAGRPKPAPVGFEHCDCCVACDMAAASAMASEAPPRRVGLARDVLPPVVSGAGRAPFRVAARDPPALS